MRASDQMELGQLKGAAIRGIQSIVILGDKVDRELTGLFAKSISRFLLRKSVTYAHRYKVYLIISLPPASLIFSKERWVAHVRGQSPHISIRGYGGLTDEYHMTCKFPDKILYVFLRVCLRMHPGETIRFHLR